MMVKLENKGGKSEIRSARIVRSVVSSSVLFEDASEGAKRFARRVDDDGRRK
jgi:hypothetical protein